MSFQVDIHTRIAENMFQFLLTLNPPLREIAVIVDDSELGESVLTHLIERTMHSRIRIVSQIIISKQIKKSDFLAAMEHGVNSFIIDCDGTDALAVFRLANDLGAAGLSVDIKWILSKRTMDSLPISCTIPAGTYYGLKPKEPVMNASYIVDIVECNSDETATQSCAVRYAALSYLQNTKHEFHSRHYHYDDRH